MTIRITLEGAGLFTAFAGSQLRPVFHVATDLRQKVAVPLLGIVSMVTSADEVRRARTGLIRFMVGTGGLVGSFVLVILLILKNLCVVSVEQVGAKKRDIFS